MNATEQKMLDRMMELMAWAHELLPETLPPHLAHAQYRRDSITNAVVHGILTPIAPVTPKPVPPETEIPPVDETDPVTPEHPIATPPITPEHPIEMPPVSGNAPSHPIESPPDFGKPEPKNW